MESAGGLVDYVIIVQQVLTEQAAIEIYKYKLALFANSKPSPGAKTHIGHVSVRGRSAPLSKLYGVSPRTIRDIWSQQT